jgi:hypothetical protein
MYSLAKIIFEILLCICCYETACAAPVLSVVMCRVSACSAAIYLAVSFFKYMQAICIKCVIVSNAMLYCMCCDTLIIEVLALYILAINLLLSAMMSENCKLKSIIYTFIAFVVFM